MHVGRQAARTIQAAGSTCRHRPGAVRAASSSPEQVEQAKAFEEGLAALARQALQNDPEAAAQLKRYEEAVVRFEKAKAAEAELEKIMLEATKAAALEEVQQQERSKAVAEQVLADAEVAAAEKLLAAAQLEFDQAAAERAQLAGAALTDADRVESGKAAGLAVVGGLAASLPFALGATSGGGGAGAAELLSLGSVVACCALFGVTYRYAVRQDAGNPHLRGGAIAAFALVRAAGGFDLLARSAAAAGGGDGGDAAAAAAALGGVLAPEVLGPAALYAGQSALVFGFAAAALEAAFARGWLQRMRGSAF